MLYVIAKDHRFPLSQREQFLAFVRRNAIPRLPFYVLVTTCDRVAVFLDAEEIPHAIHASIGTPGGPDAIAAGAETLSGPAAVLHLFRLVCGLESPLVGETQIQNQVKEAYREASRRQTVSPLLHRLFQSALRVGKKVRTETGISRGAMSHSHGAWEILKKLGVNISRARVTLLGAGRLNQNVVRYLVKNGAGTVFLANRSYTQAARLAGRLQCRAFRLDQLAEQLKHTDILICATSAPHAIVRLPQFPRDREMIVIDLAMPRDVEEQIGTLAGVHLFNLTDVENTLLENRRQRRTEAAAARRIIEEEADRFISRHFVLAKHGRKHETDAAATSVDLFWPQTAGSVL